MRKNIINMLRVGSSAALLTLTSTALATNGMFTIAPGTKSRGMGGVSIATTHDTLSSAVNPAIMAHTGNRFDIGGDILMIDAESTLGQGTNRITVESKPRHFTISDGIYMLPNMGASFDMGDYNLGFTMVGVGGGGSEYSTNLYNNVGSGDPAIPLGVSLLIMNMNPTYARKLDSQNSIGASLIIGVQVFKAFGLGEFLQFTSTQDAALSRFNDEGAEVTYGFGARVGWLGEFMKGKLRVGAEYTTKTDMEEFDKYTDLFAERGDIDTPGNIGFGFMYQVDDKITVGADINHIFYEDVKAISNSGPNVTAGAPFPVDRATNALGEAGGLGFGWENQTVFKIGGTYQYAEDLVLRAGWNYAESPIDESRQVLFNIVAPATTQNHLTLGGTYTLGKDSELSFNYIHAFEFSQGGPTYIGFEGEISMSQNVFGGAYSLRF